MTGTQWVMTRPIAPIQSALIQSALTQSAAIQSAAMRSASSQPRTITSWSPEQWTAGFHPGCSDSPFSCWRWSWHLPRCPPRMPTRHRVGPISPTTCFSTTPRTRVCRSRSPRRSRRIAMDSSGSAPRADSRDGTVIGSASISLTPRIRPHCRTTSSPRCMSMRAASCGSEPRLAAFRSTTASTIASSRIPLGPAA